MAVQSDSNECNTQLFCLKITFVLTYELHNSIYMTQSKEHVHILNELHITIQSAGHQWQSHLGKKGVNRGVEQSHAQWIISNPKTKPVHIIL